MTTRQTALALVNEGGYRDLASACAALLDMGVGDASEAQGLLEAAERGDATVYNGALVEDVPLCDCVGEELERWGCLCS